MWNLEQDRGYVREAAMTKFLTAQLLALINIWGKVFHGEKKESPLSTKKTTNYKTLKIKGYNFSDCLQFHVEIETRGGQTRSAFIVFVLSATRGNVRASLWSCTRNARRW